MSGTDHGAQSEWGGPQPHCVLVRPQMGENIGAAARAMLNFGLERLRVVDPRDGWPNSRAVAMASATGVRLKRVRARRSGMADGGRLNGEMGLQRRRLKQVSHGNGAQDEQRGARGREAGHSR